jgi:hypothetical protein
LAGFLAGSCPSIIHYYIYLLFHILQIFFLLFYIFWPVNCSDYQAKGKDLNRLLPESATSRKPGGLNIRPQPEKQKHISAFTVADVICAPLLFAAKAANNSILRCFVGK